ncbi:hypothetical protein QOL99_13850 [Deinococcus sp. MIMF12]|uniref:Uncharacterized protein n=1 Tax=Deinococcus rhizophilus TaxID=3049544 RepID=A0ABT7JJJ1_9DEIO|nr:hypothetical protein [Deinococcus rhizophilus]MDL2345224.1 hypothetical protein [Deinococcus rhizophilus]
MKTRTLSLLLAATTALSMAAAQTRPPTTPAAPPASTPATTKTTPTIVSATVSGQWEYLVISFGKTYFSSPADLQAKTSGQSKLMIYGPLGGVVASEALDTQAQVDTLGKYGWELIGVLGAIGGDQQWVFKRPYDAARAATEAAQIRREGAELAAAREKAAREAAAKPAPATPTTPTELVDLDAREAQAKREAENQTLRNRISSALQLTGWPMARVDAAGLSVMTYDGKPNTSGQVTVMLDATQRALTGNTYRQSAVDALIAEYVNTLKSQGRFSSIEPAKYSVCLDGGTALRIGASIRFNNELKDVISPYTATHCVK